jgi:hypothetical protein
MPSAKPEIVPRLSDEEMAELDEQERRLEAWHLSITGHSQRAIGKMFGVGPTTIGRWLDQVGVDRRTRAENIELETERIIGTLEAVAMKSWQVAEELSGSDKVNSMAIPSHLKNVIEAAREIARLRGIEPTRRSEQPGFKATEVIVRIGGTRDSPPIDVTAREIAS